MTRTCLDLFSGLGGFSAAFEDADGWEVVTVDLDPDDRFDPDIRTDVMDLRPADLPDADVILASPPCVDFSVACVVDKWDLSENRRPKHLPKVAQVAESMALVFRTLWLAHEIRPRYWFMENPQGMLGVWLGKPCGKVHYCQYGIDFKKPTDLWGRHPPMRYRTCPGPTACGHGDFQKETWGTLRDDDSAERARVPYDLSLAIREAVEDAYANPPPEQSTLAEVTRS